eukprot:1116304-Rhodomonas_salina.2
MRCCALWRDDTGVCPAVWRARLCDKCAAREHDLQEREQELEEKEHALEALEERAEALEERAVKAEQESASARSLLSQPSLGSLARSLSRALSLGVFLHGTAWY